LLASIPSHAEPQYFSQAVRDPQWREDMAHEITTLEENNTWIFASLSPEKRALGYRWVYKIKYHADGSIERYKARLVALGNTQVQGEDFTEIFAPVAKMVTVRCLITVEVSRGWPLHQMDVDNAFLHGDLDDKIYIKPPPGFHPP